MGIFEDLAAEQERLEKILLGLDEAQWLSPSAAEGWTIADVVLHLAQSEEGVEATAAHRQLRTGLAAAAGVTMDDRAAQAVQMERAAPAEVFARWQHARQAGLAALRAADPDQPVQWGRPAAGRGAVRADRPEGRWAGGRWAGGRWAGRGGDVAVRAAGRRVGHHRDGRRLLPGGRAAARPGRVRAAGQRAARRHRPAGAADLRGLRRRAEAAG